MINYIYPKNIADLPDEESVERWEAKTRSTGEWFAPKRQTKEWAGFGMDLGFEIRYIPKQPGESVEVAAANYADDNTGILEEHENLYQAFKAGAAWAKSQEGRK